MESRQLCVDDQILMKEIDEGEVVNIFNAIDAERDYLSEWLPFVEKTTDIEFTRGFVNSYLYSDKNDVTFAIYFEKRFAGLIGLKDTDEMNMKTEKFFTFPIKRAFLDSGMYPRIRRFSQCKSSTFMFL